MAQYDLLLEQNVHATLVEYSEKFVHLSKGDLLSADTSHIPTVLAAGTDGYYLKRDDAAATGLAWVVAPGGCALSGSTDNTICTVTGANAIQGEANLTWNSSNILGIAGDVTFGSGAARTIKIADGTSSAYDLYIRGQATTTVSAGDIIIMGGAISSASYNAGDIYISGGINSSSAMGGAIFIEGGPGGTGGSVYIEAGDGSSTDGDIYIGQTHTASIRLLNSALSNADALDGEILFCDASDSYKIKRADNVVIGASTSTYLAFWDGTNSITGNAALTYNTSTYRLYNNQSYNGDVNIQAHNSDESGVAARATLVASATNGPYVYLMAFGTGYTGTQFGITASELALLYTGTGSSAMCVGYNTTSGTLYLACGTLSTATAVNRIGLDYGGYVGVGVNPSTSYKFQVYLNEASKYVGFFDQDSSTGHGVRIDIDATSGSYYFLNCYAASSSVAYLTADGKWTAADYILSSDARLKKNIKPIENGLEMALALNPVTFDWRDCRDEYNHVGFIAQDVREVREELAPNDGVSYSRITAINNAAIHELNKKINELELTIKELKNGRSS